MFADPLRIAGQLNLQAKMTVVDFGAGDGRLTLELAKRVREGRVYAVDVQKGLLDRLRSEARGVGLNNIETLWGNVEKRHGVNLPDGSADRVVIANLLFQSAARYSVALEAWRLLRPGGEAAVIDWTGSFGGLGPRADQVVSPAEAKKIFAEAGFASAREFTVGDQHWGLIFEKP